MDNGRQGDHLLRNRTLLIKEFDQNQEISEAQWCQALDVITFIGHL